MKVLTSAREMRAFADAEVAAGRRIALVPTMGYLHEGHTALCEVARRHGEVVVATIFVNPTQFGPKEDLGRYPRDLEGDLEKLEGVGVDVVFAPEGEGELYPQGFDTYVTPDKLAAGLCGAARPGHFRGVCTVVLLLLRITRAHAAVFGEKDYQQLTILRRMARDLWLDVEVIGAPIVREPDGLAMSSRNVYLQGDERRQALVLSRALARVEALVRQGERATAALLDEARRVIAEAPAARLDYVSIVGAGDLAPLERVDGPAVCALAVFVGATRLIDNRRID